MRTAVRSRLQIVGVDVFAKVYGFGEFVGLFPG